MSQEAFSPGPLGNHSPMISNLQALRAVAAVSVVLFHILGTSASYGQGTELLTFLRRWGDFGVDLFFIISGFVMMQSRFNQRRTFSQFVTMRAARIIPLYWSLTATLALLGMAWPSAIRGKAISLSWTLASLGFVSQVACERTPILSVGWTLEWEMMFYVVFASALFLRSLKMLVAWVSLMMVLLACVLRESIGLEFLLGMVAACVYHRWQLPRRIALAMLGTGLLALLAASHPRISGLGLDRFVGFGIPSFLVLNGAVHCQQTRNRLLVFLGDASYSIYLIQVFTISVFYKLSSKTLVGMNGDILAAACWVLSILSGCLLYSLYEKRVTLWLRSLVGASARPGA